MYSIQIKRRAQTLRKNGVSIYDIARVLNLNVTTISYWCRDIRLSKVMIDKISRRGKFKARAAMLVYTENQRKERFRRTKENRIAGAKLVGDISDRNALMVGLGLYWGEGYKESSGELGFTNSNLNIMKFYIKWLKFFGVAKEDLIFRLTLNDIFRAQERRLKKYWVSGLRVSEKQFTATSFIKTNLKKAITSKGNTYTGVLRVKVRRGNSLKNKILGAIDHISACV